MTVFGVKKEHCFVLFSVSVNFHGVTKRLTLDQTSCRLVQSLTLDGTTC